jgi:ABC-type polysaccharide/polyol phosphate transport system ATPase subunit
MASFELTGVSLRYQVFQAGDLSMKSAVKAIVTGGLISQNSKRKVEIRALENINMVAREGDRIGLVGHNGAGKTTLLKVLSGIYRPQSGRVRRIGKTVSVINPSMGMNPSLTGYENIENLLLMFGLSWAEIRSRMPDIEEFTELGDFLALPVNTYSAGMKTRLAFSVATSFHPEILLVDEHLAAGDAGFMKRAQERMRAMMERSSILVLASHSLSIINEFCNRAVLLEHGAIHAQGTPAEVVEVYNQRTSAQNAAPPALSATAS